MSKSREKAAAETCQNGIVELMGHENREVIELRAKLEALERDNKELRNSVEKWRLLAENTPDHILLIDKDLRIQHANHASPGLNVEELIGKYIYDFVDEKLEIKSILRDALKSGTPTSYETQYKIPGGDTIHYESFVIPQKKSINDEVEILILAARNITNRKHSENAKDQAISDLKNALEKVKVLSGFLPICCSCKKIRDDQGYWNQIERYIKDHSEAEFSHSLCPECTHHLYPKLSRKET